MKLSIGAVLLAGIMLVSCNSFNKTTVYENPKQVRVTNTTTTDLKDQPVSPVTSQLPSKPATHPKQVIGGYTEMTLCSPMNVPNDIPIPPIPINRNNKDQIDDKDVTSITLNHIRDVRSYALQLRNQLSDLRNKSKTNCKKYKVYTGK